MARRVRTAALAASITWSCVFAAESRAQPTQAPAPDSASAVAVVPPELTTFVEAVYPESERASARTAQVTMRLSIDPSGAVVQADVVSSGGAAFDAAAVAAARQFRFRPAQLQGRAIGVRILYRYDFTLTPERPTTATLAGLVRDRQTRQPLAGIRVRAGHSLAASATTGQDGRFAIESLPPGPQPVVLDGPSLTETRTEETLVAGERLDVTYDVFVDAPAGSGDDAGDDLEIVVTAPALRRSAV